MKKSMTQGALAVTSGKCLENLVENYLRSAGIDSLNYRKWISDEESPKKSTGLLLKNVPYVNIYGGNSRGEFILSVDGKPDVRIECRFQGSRGSVDEKMPYLFETAVAFEESTVVLVIEGDGYKKGAKSWLKTSCNSIFHKNILMVTMSEFKDWADNFINA